VRSAQESYIQEHHKSKSVRELARDLKISRKKVQEIIDTLGQSPKSVSRGTAPEAAAPALPFKKHLWIVLGILAFTFLIYARTLGYPFINWDDPRYIVDNIDIRTLNLHHLQRFFSTPYVGVYAPLTMVSFALDYQLFHFHAWGYHASNTLLHLASTAMVYGIVLSLAGEWLVALGVALIFGIHPVQPESVVWISQRKNVLSFFFFLVAFSCHIRARRAADPKASRSAAIASVIAFILACLAKPLSVMLPPILMAYDYCYGYWSRKTPLKYAPHLIVSLTLGLISIAIAHDATHGGSIGGSRWTTFLTVMVAMMKYIQLMFVPVHQSILYPFPLYRSLLHPHVLLSAGGLAAGAWGIFYLWNKDRGLFFWAVWYLILLFPVLNIIPLLDYMQDRWLYLPLVGIFTILLTLIVRQAGRGMCAVAIAVLTVFFSLANLNRQQVWANPEALWLETRKVSKEYWSSPYYNLGHYYVKNGELDKAIPEFERTIERFNHPGAWGALGTVYLKKGMLDKAVPYFQKALELAPEEAAFYNELGLIYKEQKKYAEAIELYDKAISLEPDRPANYNNKAVAYAMLGKTEKAEEAFRKSLEVDPDFEETLVNYAGFLFKTGRLEESESCARKLIRLFPGSQHRPMMEKILEKVTQAKSSAGEASSVS